jgi:hypothetical protein
VIGAGRIFLCVAVNAILKPPTISSPSARVARIGSAISDRFAFHVIPVKATAPERAAR